MLQITPILPDSINEVEYKIFLQHYFFIASSFSEKAACPATLNNCNESTFLLSITFAK
jgi:hypothetical protein